jgi:hypothetical protein
VIVSLTGPPVFKPYEKREVKPEEIQTTLKATP